MDRPRFPFAHAPEIIRSQQKDSYIESILKDDIITLLQKFKGSRFLHNHSLGVASAANLAYLALTTGFGARTLGEEYVDIFHVSSDGKNLPSWKRRVGYVLSTSLGPICILRLLGRLRSNTKTNTPLGRIIRKISEANSVQVFLTAHLALFYFFGAYYQVAKRVWGLRYAFGHKVNPLEGRSGYELLGALIILQYLARYFGKMATKEDASDKTSTEDSSEHADVIDLSNSAVLPYIPEVSRKCTLCLEYMKDPSATLCGHIFCWTCGSEWMREKPECPLCRQACLEQNLLPLRP